ncbi:PITH domain-containing protein 1 isoform X3 [Rana temporaria]|uniref:PITH domain-containing protein 1 isoform X3 n=1 Tax=Rana temporaria TaxID=8407 RepID=UPI001AAE15C9|nr:PITH domain-containing protein 1 isoform X3 [Rana temporaria]
MSHGHSHGGDCSCSAERSDGPERGLEYGLYQKIDLEKLQCLNESEEGSGKTVFRAWEERGDRSRFVESDDDEELLFNIPFTGNVKLKGIIIIGEDSDAHPSEMRLISRFSSVSHLSIHISKNFGAENTKIFYIGLRGEWTEAHRHEVTICNYESAANPADHKVTQINPQSHFIS